MKKIIIIGVILLIFVFTGTWIFGGLSKFFHIVGNIFEWLQQALNFFGLNKGIV